MGILSTIGSIAKGIIKFISPVSQIAGSLIEAKGTTSANKANVAIMREQNAWNKKMRLESQTWSQKMSDTAHLREVLDLKKSGLNPILSGMGGGGAHTPNTGQPAASSAVAQNTMQGQRKNAIEMIESLSRIKLFKEQTLTTSKSGTLIDTQTETQKGLTEKVKAEASSAKSMARIDKVRADIQTSKWGKGAQWVDTTLKPIKGIIGGGRIRIRTK